MTERAPLTFVVFGDDWGRHVSSIQHLFARLIPWHSVVWVNALNHRVPTLSLRDLRRAWEKGLAMVRPRPVRPALGDVRPQVVLEPRVLPWHLHPVVSAFNAWSLERAILHSLARTPSHATRVLVTGSPASVPLVGRLGESAAIYFCMDDFLELPGTSPAMLEPLEQRLLRAVDAVVATAQSLVESKRCARGPGYYLPQGVNFEHFAAPQPIPPEISRLRRPIVGFAGGVSAACDLPTIQATAEALAQGSVVLVGPVAVPAESLAAPNIHLLGPRSYAELPAYVQAFDVGIIPYTESAWTRAVDPLKLLEYLAAGIPVVTSPLPEVMKYSDVVEVAALGGPFVQAVVHAATLHHADALRRGQDVARANGWDRRAERFLEIVEGVLAARASGLRVPFRGTQ